MWDLKWKPASDDPRGMTLVSNKFWSDIYMLNRDPQTNGTSRNNIAIADGETGGTTTCIIPTAFGGNGSSRYSIQDWWSTNEALSAFGKRLPTYGEFSTLAYGVTENVSRGNDPVTTGLGTTNTGSGGGGGGRETLLAHIGGNGGSGFVAIRYSDSFPLAGSTTGSPTITTSGGYRIYQWTGSGSITF